MRGGGSSSPSELSILYANIRSLIPKRDRLSALINDTDADIILLSETWLSDQIATSELFQCHKTFTVHRCDRSERRGGGVLIAVNECFQCTLLKIPCRLEIVWCYVTICFQKIVFGICYRPPNSNGSFCEELHDCLSHISALTPGIPVFLLGDFNFPSIQWSHPCPFAEPASAETSYFLTTCLDYNLSQLVRIPTRVTPSTSHLLDLILTSSPDIASEITHLPGLSDHDVLHFSISVPRNRRSNRFKLIKDYNKTNFEAINTELSSFLDSFCLSYNDATVEKIWTCFKDKALHLIKKHIPVRKVYHSSNAPWYTRYLNRLSNKKKRLFRAAKKSSSADKWSTYTTAAKAYSSALKETKFKFYNNTLPSLLQSNPKRFWNVVRNRDNLTIALTDKSGESIPSSQCASTLNTVFARSFCATHPDICPRFTAPSYVPMEPILLDSSGIRSIINNLKRSSSCGIDGITSKFLQATAEYSSILLNLIFTKSLNSSSLPKDWKTGKVIPLHKSGDTHNPQNYRPISLTSIPCKIFEHVIFSHLVNFLESNKFFHSSQHGFRKTFSCETQLATFCNDLHAFLDNGFTVDCIFLDFAKAFDRVSHRLLLFKLSQLSIDPLVFNWIREFLSNRTQYVSINDKNSPEVPVDSGVPQGSVLAPLLFLIYINDLPNQITSSICLFADDCVLYRKIEGPNDTLTLQNDLNNISTWCKLWVMDLNTSKCKTMRISRSISACPNYLLNNTSLDQVTSYKYLGVHITNNLSWKRHIEYITSKANRMLGYLKRNFSLAPPKLKQQLYITYVRSNLEYACSIWDPGHASLTNIIENVQNRAVRFILHNYHRTASVTDMKRTLGIPLLSSRRRLSRLCLFHKIYYHNNELKSRYITSASYISPRVDHPFKVHVPSQRTVTYSYSFLPKTSYEWNHLPASLVAIRDPDRFRKALTNTL